MTTEALEQKETLETYYEKEILQWLEAQDKIFSTKEQLIRAFWKERYDIEV